MSGDIHSTGGYCHYTGGSSGSVSVTDSNFNNIRAQGGYGYSTGGHGGNISITKTNGALDIKDKTINTGGGGSYGGYTNGVNGTLTLTADNLLTNENTFFYNVASLIINSINLGPWNGVFQPTTYYFDDKNTHDGDWNNPLNWWIDADSTTPLDSIVIAGSNVVVKSDVLTDSSGSPSVYVNSVEFKNGTVNHISIISTQGSVFQSGSSNVGTTTGTTVFNATSTNVGTTTGITTFNDSSNNIGVVINNATTTFNGDLASSSGLVVGISVASASFTDTPGSMDFTTSHFPIIPGSISGIDSNGGTISDDGDGNIISTMGGNVGTVSYATGVIQSNSNTIEDVIFSINYTYSYNVPNATSTPIQRIFTSPVATVRNFLTEAGHNNWIVVAQGAIVDLTNAIYSRTTNFFKALFGGSFVTNPNIDGGASVVPQIVVTNPVANSTIIKWTTPSINWDTASSSGATCEYNIDGGEYQTLVCGNAGNDIPRPSAGSHTLYIRGTDSRGDVSELVIPFTYDNTQPTYTTCGTDLLDEASRPYYYLQGNVTGDCKATVDTTLLGTSTLNARTGYTLNGNIIATSTGAGLTLTLKAITVTGTTTVVGASNNSGTGFAGGHITTNFVTTGPLVANGGNGISGGLGGTISMASSTTAGLFALGGNANVSGQNGNGGHGGTISIIHSKQIASSTLVSVAGGDALVCGRGGSGGTITATSSTYDIKTTSAGADQTTIGAGLCAAPPSGSSGSSGSFVGSGGGFISDPSDPGYSAPSNNQNTPAPSPSTSPAAPGGSISTVDYAKFVAAGIIPTVTLPVNVPQKLVLTPLPSFGEGKGSFNIASTFDNFTKLTFVSLAHAPALSSYLASLGIETDQDVVNLRSSPIPVATTTTPIPGLYKVNRTSIPLKTPSGFARVEVPVSSAFTSTSKTPLSQSVTVFPQTTMTISVIPTTNDKVTGTFNGKSISFTTVKGVATATVTTPRAPGTYTLTTSASPLPLTVTVATIQPRADTEPQPAPSVWSRVLGWFGW